MSIDDASGRDLRRRILRATGELVAKRGYRDVTIELIVNRGRVSKSSFYKHYRSKEGAFLALFEAAFREARERVLAALDGVPEEAWPERVVAALGALVELIVANPIVARATIVEAPTAGPATLERYEQANRALVPLFEGGRRFHPHGADLPSTLEITLAGSVLWSAYQRIIVGESDRVGAILPEIVELVLRPYLGEDQAARLARDIAPI
ncbi:MAG TPA: TetR/AcrR family transcriptional regulator [Solirubrobacterales bacterium]